MLEQKYITGSMPLHTTNLSLKTCGGPEDFTSTAISNKCGVTIVQGAGMLHSEKQFGAPNLLLD